MNVVTNGNYCVKCHLIGDYNPPGTDRVKAPDLSVVHKRLRGDYLRKWLAKPTSIQPYTSMPVNIPFDPDAPLMGTTVPQQLYHGTSVGATRRVGGSVDELRSLQPENVRPSRRWSSNLPAPECGDWCIICRVAMCVYCLRRLNAGCLLVAPNGEYS